MATEVQEHPLTGGRTLTISRNGRHQYWIDNGIKMPSVTGLVAHIEGDSFGAGMGWALKTARQNGGDLDSPRRKGDEARDEGIRLHGDIDAYVKSGVVSEENPLFVSWLNALGDQDWIASEQFVYSASGYGLYGTGHGGTLDAVSRDADGGGLCVWDWKTVSESWHNYGSSLRKAKDSAQLAAYAYALRAMGSVYAPTRGRIGYVLRDGSEVVVETIDLDWGWKLFCASMTIYALRKGTM